MLLVKGGGETKVTEIVETSRIKRGVGFSTSWERELKVPTNKRCELLCHADFCIRERYVNHNHNQDNQRSHRETY